MLVYATTLNNTFGGKEYMYTVNVNCNSLQEEGIMTQYAALHEVKNAFTLTADKVLVKWLISGQMIFFWWVGGGVEALNA